VLRVVLGEQLVAQHMHALLFGRDSHRNPLLDRSVKCTGRPGRCVDRPQIMGAASGGERDISGCGGVWWF
jgi:hypothetical protein